MYPCYYLDNVAKSGMKGWRTGGFIAEQQQF